MLFHEGERGVQHQTTHFYERSARWRLTYDPAFEGAKERKCKGIKMLAAPSEEAFEILFSNREH